MVSSASTTLALRVERGLVEAFGLEGEVRAWSETVTTRTMRLYSGSLRNRPSAAERFADAVVLIEEPMSGLPAGSAYAPRQAARTAAFYAAVQRLGEKSVSTARPRIDIRV